MNLLTIYTEVRDVFKAHEKLFLAVVGGAALYFAIGRVDTLVIHHDQARLSQAQVVLASQQSKDATTAALAQQEAAAYKAQAALVAQQNAALEQANATLQAALVAQQKTDNTMTPTELTDRWNVLVPNASAAPAAAGVTVSDAGAHATVSQLEEVPVLTKQLTDTKTELQGVNALLLSSNGQIATLNTLVAGKTKELTDQQAVCTEQIKVVKAEARKSKKRWFIAGYILGLVTKPLISGL